MNRPCPLCDQPIADTGTVCHDCTAKTKADLGRVALRWYELETTVLRQDRIGDPAKTTVEQPLPYSWAADHDRDAIVNTLTTWARIVEDERGIEAPLRDGVPGEVICALWLATQLDWLRHRDYGHEALDELTHCARIIGRAIDRPAQRQYAGPCTCGLDLYAPRYAAQVQCRQCEKTYDVRARREWLLEQADHTLAHASLIARALDELGEPVKPERIRQWASRGRLIPKATDPAGRKLYAVREVRDLIRQEEQRTYRGARHAQSGGVA